MALSAVPSRSQVSSETEVARLGNASLRSSSIIARAHRSDFRSHLSLELVVISQTSVDAATTTTTCVSCVGDDADRLAIECNRSCVSFFPVAMAVSCATASTIQPATTVNAVKTFTTIDRGLGQRRAMQTNALVSDLSRPCYDSTEDASCRMCCNTLLTNGGRRRRREAQH